MVCSGVVHPYRLYSSTLYQLIMRNAMQASSQVAKSHRLMLCDWKWPCHTLSIFLETSWNHSALGMFLQTKPSHINLSPLQHPALQLWRLRQQPDSNCENEPVVKLGGYKRSVSRSWDERYQKISKEYQQILKVCLRMFADVFWLAKTCKNYSFFPKLGSLALAAATAAGACASFSILQWVQMGPGWGKLRWVPEGRSYKHEALHHRIA